MLWTFRKQLKINCGNGSNSTSFILLPQAVCNVYEDDDEFDGFVINYLNIIRKLSCFMQSNSQLCLRYNFTPSKQSMGSNKATSREYDKWGKNLK